MSHTKFPRGPDPVWDSWLCATERCTCSVSVTVALLCVPLRTPSPQLLFFSLFLRGFHAFSLPGEFYNQLVKLPEHSSWNFLCKYIELVDELEDRSLLYNTESFYGRMGFLLFRFSPVCLTLPVRCSPCRPDSVPVGGCEVVLAASANRSCLFRDLF